MNEVGLGWGPWSRDDRGHRDQRGDHDRHIDQEDRAPPEVLQDAAGDGAGGDGEADHTGPDADGLGLLRGLEDVHDDREGGGQDEGAAEAHHGAEGDELPGGVRQRGQYGSHTEHGHAEEQHLLAAEPITEQTRGEEQSGEDQRVGVDRPLQLALGGAESGGSGLAMVFSSPR